MDNMFRLVNLQSDQSFNSRKTSSSATKSSTQNHTHQQECKFSMDEDISSSSSKHFFPCHNSTTTNTTQLSESDFSTDLNLTGASEFTSNPSSKWASNLILECARAIAGNNSGRVQQLLRMLNELASPYGDIQQKLAAYFLRALFAKTTDSGERCYRTLTTAAENNCSFGTTRKMMLKFQEVSPWTTFGHVAANGAILEALQGENKLHIIDISTTFCTQWPTLLEALATRNDDTPHLRITNVVIAPIFVGTLSNVGGQKLMMKEIGQRIEKFARLMGVPFQFNLVHHVGDLYLNLDEIKIEGDETLVVNCVGTLHMVAPHRRDDLISSFLRLRPKIFTVVEDEADFDYGSSDFVTGVTECLRWYSIYFESLDESFTRISNERLMLERAAGRGLVNFLSCPPRESIERREVAARWLRRMSTIGFSSGTFSEDVLGDVSALLTRYKDGWSMIGNVADAGAGIFLAWKGKPVVWASAWKPLATPRD